MAPQNERDRWELPRPGAGAPNVVVILLDDLGFGQLGCFGSDMDTPNIDALAAGGLRYNRFHVTSLCSPTRASLLTGRNHHSVGVGFLVDIPSAEPGYHCRVPKSAGTMPRLLRDAGYNTLAVGKWHLTPRGERSNAGPFDRWPLGFGFERYYGFLRGDANHWAPPLVRDNRYVDPPRSPADGYHLTEDLVDEAVRSVYEQKISAPDRPFLLYFATGAMHAPHHVTPEWVAPYHGRFDDGWEACRERIFARQLAEGIVPEGTTLSERPPWIDRWADLSPDARRLYARMQEVFAGFLTHTDAQIGRLVSFLREIGELDNTLILLASDNGASGEGGVVGTFNEHRFTQQLDEDIADEVARLDEYGGFRSYNHYAWGWAWAGNTPLRLWKRYTWLGGTRTPLIVHWPDGISARGEVRDQFVHVVDLMPTILGATGVSAPDTLDGVTQLPLHGADIAATFDDAGAPSPRDVQYFEMLGSRSIVAGRWKATTDHVSTGVADEERLLEGSRDFATDRWLLFDLEEDFAETRDLAAEHPDVLTGLQERWTIEAARHDVFPMADGLLQRVGSMLPTANRPRPRTVLLPIGGPVPDEALPMLFGGFTLLAEVDVPEGGAEGVLCEIGDWTTGFAVYVLAGRLTVVLNHASDEHRFVSGAPVPVGRHQLGCRFEAGFEPMLHVLHDDEVVASGPLPGGIPITWQHGGTALTLGYATDFPVTDGYAPPFRWTGDLHRVVIEVPSASRPPAADAQQLRSALRSE
jgi:arylsulfatase